MCYSITKTKTKTGLPEKNVKKISEKFLFFFKKKKGENLLIRKNIIKLL